MPDIFDDRTLDPRADLYCGGGHVGFGHETSEETMSKGALALLIHGGTDNWSPERWKSPV